MIKHTIEEIKEEVFRIWGDNIRDIEVEVSIGKEVKITIKQMYEYVSCTFSQLEELSKFFDTKNINFENGYSHGGCETCDYGSSYAIDITIG